MRAAVLLPPPRGRRRLPTGRAGARRAGAARALPPLLALLLPLACATPPVGHDVDPQAAIGAFRSFAILPTEAEEVPQDPRFGPLLDRHTEEAIAWTLRARGYEQGEAAGVDFLVSYRNEVQEEARIDTHPVTVGLGYGTVFSGVGLGTRWYGPLHSTARTIVKGRLVIDVLEPSTGHLVWRGWTEDTLSPAGDPRRDIFAAVDRILRQFPAATPR